MNWSDWSDWSELLIIIIRNTYPDIPLSDVRTILTQGYVSCAPEREGDNWKVKVERRMPGGRDAACVTLILRDGKFLLIKTVLWEDY